MLLRPVISRILSGLAWLFWKNPTPCQVTVNDLQLLIERIAELELVVDELRRKAEATRRKVYRDGDAMVPQTDPGNSKVSPEMLLAGLKAGDEVPPGLF